MLLKFHRQPALIGILCLAGSLPLLFVRHLYYIVYFRGKQIQPVSQSVTTVTRCHCSVSAAANSDYSGKGLVVH